MDLQLKGKVVVVTGEANDIAAAVLRACTEDGAIPILMDSEQGSAESYKVAINRVATDFGRIDALIHNAGPIAEVGLEQGGSGEYVASVHRKLVQHYSMAHFASPHLKESRGTIVNVVSRSPISGRGTSSSSASLRAGVMALTREWAAELHSFGVRVNTVLPADGMTSNTSFGRHISTPDQIAATVTFLLSPLSGHTTGQHVHVDGRCASLNLTLN